MRPGLKRVMWVAQPVSAGADVNGNGRRGWIIYDADVGVFGMFLREWGSGSLLAELQSERVDLTGVVELGRRLDITGREWRELNRFKQNPTLAILNPPIQRHRTGIGSNRHRDALTGAALMSNRVYELRYRHVEDRKDYKHEFGANVEMFALEDGTILLKHRHGEPLSEDF